MSMTRDEAEARLFQGNLSSVGEMTEVARAAGRCADCYAPLGTGRIPVTDLEESQGGGGYLERHYGETLPCSACVEYRRGLVAKSADKCVGSPGFDCPNPATIPLMVEGSEIQVCAECAPKWGPQEERGSTVFQFVSVDEVDALAPGEVYTIGIALDRDSSLIITRCEWGNLGGSEATPEWRWLGDRALIWGAMDAIHVPGSDTHLPSVIVLPHQPNLAEVAPAAVFLIRALSKMGRIRLEGWDEASLGRIHSVANGEATIVFPYSLSAADRVAAVAYWLLHGVTGKYSMDIFRAACGLSGESPQVHVDFELRLERVEKK